MTSSISSPSAVSQAMSYDSSAETDPTKQIRKEFRGYDSEFKPSVQEQIDMVPIVQYYKKNLQQLAAQQEEKQKKIEAYEELKSYASKFYEACNVLRKPEEDVNNAFLLKSTSISSTEGTGTDFLQVDAGYGANTCSFNVSVNKLATNNRLRFGVEDMTNVTAANNIIQNLAYNTIGDIQTQLDAMAITKDQAGFPTNPLIRDLYILVKSYATSSRHPIEATNLTLLRNESDNLYNHMISNGQNISSGFSSLTAQAVEDGTNSLNPGDYYLYGFAGGVNPAKTLKAQLDAGNYNTPQEVIDAITEYINSFQGSDVQNNPMLQAMLNAAEEEFKTATNDPAGALSVKNAAMDEFQQYKDQCKVTFDDGDSLELVIAKINSTSDYSGVRANYVLTSSGSYLLEILSQKTGLDYQIEIYDNDEVTQKEWLSDIQEETVASNSELIIDGHFVSSNSNNIKYAESINLNLKKTNNPGESETVSISGDSKVLQVCIANFVSSYNDLKEFIAKQTERDPSTYLLKDTAILGNDSFVMDIDSQLTNFPIRSLDYSEGYKAFADIGITLSSNRKLVGSSLDYLVLDVDEEKLKNAINTNFDEVRRVFEFAFETTDPRVNIVSHDGSYSGLGKIKFWGHSVRDINDMDGKLHNVKIEIYNPDGTLKKTEYYDTTYGKIIICPQTSLLSGMTFSFSEDVVDNVEITMKQGIADQLFGFIRRYTDDSLRARTGLITDTENEQIMSTSSLVTQINSLESKLKQEENAQARRIASYMERSAAAKIKANFLEMYLEALTSNR